MSFEDGTYCEQGSAPIPTFPRFAGEGAGERIENSATFLRGPPGFPDISWLKSLPK
jgi:hypothetical protein